MINSNTDKVFTEHDKEEMFQLLTGQDCHSALPPSVTNAGEGGKFTPDGQIQPHPGNTFICHLSPDSALYQAMVNMQAAYQASRWASHFSFLPPSSFHMTIFCGISGCPLGADGWPVGIEHGASLEKVTNHYLDKLAALRAPQAFYVRPVGFHNALTLRLQGASDEEISKLRKIRDCLRDLTGLHREDHQTYQFHTTLGYIIRWFDADDVAYFLEFMAEMYQQFILPIGTTALGPVEFCQFDNMAHFETLGVSTDDGFVAR